MKEFIDIIKSDKKSKVLFIITIGVLFICTLSYSLSIFSNSREGSVANIQVNGLSFNMTTNSGESDDRILKLKANTFESFNVVLTNLNNMDVKYELIYEVCTDSDCSTTIDSLPDDVSFGVSKEVTDEISGVISNQKNILLISSNNTNQDYYIKLNLNAGYSWNELLLVNQIDDYSKNIDFIAYVDGVKQEELPNGCNYNYSYKTYVNGVESSDSNVKLTCNRALDTWSITVNNIPNKVTLFFETKQGTNLVQLIESLDKDANNIESDEFGNLRYVGGNPDNYVSYYGITFRIIGVFETDDFDVDGNKLSTTSKKVKLISTEIYTGLAFDDYTDGKYTNDWNESSLKDIFYDTITSPDFYDPVATTTWYLGGWNSAVVTRYDMYNYERGTNVPSGHNTTYIGKLGLMYPSDYAYACKGTSCSSSIYNYNNTNQTSNNWLYSGNHEWLLTPAKSDTDKVFYLEDAGGINLYHTVSNKFSVRGTFYLYSDTLTNTGDGTSNYPYVLS